jgi:cyclase
VRAPFDPEAVNLGSHQLADGVFVVLPDDAGQRDHVATTAGFVVGERSVLVVESLLTGSLAAQLMALIRRETSKPIRYLVNTSYHGDHCFGNYVFPVETIVIQHHATKAYLDVSFADDQAFMLALMGPGKGIEGAVYRPADVTVEQRVTIDLGGRVVELRHFGFAQTDGDLVVWQPDARVLWVGNMIQAPQPALPWLLDGGHRRAATTLRRVQSFLPDDATIVPGHGRPMGRSEIDHPIAYLERLDREVRDVVEAGLALQDAVERVMLPEYQTYSHYDWVHREVNVPAVYHELTAA